MGSLRITESIIDEHGCVVTHDYVLAPYHFGNVAMGLTKMVMRHYLACADIFPIVAGIEVQGPF